MALFPALLGIPVAQIAFVAGAIPGLSYGAEPAKLVFYRAGTTKIEVNSRGSIKIDGDTPVHKLPINHLWRTDIPAGEHFLYGDEKRYGRTYTFEGGKTYYFRAEYIVTTSFLKSDTFRLVAVPADIAEGEMVGLKQDQP